MRGGGGAFDDSLASFLRERRLYFGSACTILRRSGKNEGKSLTRRRRVHARPTKDNDGYSAYEVVVLVLPRADSGAILFCIRVVAVVAAGDTFVVY